MKKRKLTKASRLVNIDRLTNVNAGSIKGGKGSPQDSIFVDVPKIDIPEIVIRV